MTSTEPRESTSEYLSRREDWADIAGIAEATLEGAVPDDIEIGQAVDFKNGVLRWALEDRTAANMQWELLERTDGLPFKSRDDYVEKLWESITDGENRDLKKRIEDRWKSLGGYEDYLFQWFLTRFNLGAARRVYRGARLPRALHWLILGVSIIFLALLWRFSYLSVVWTLRVVFAELVLLSLGWRLSGLRPVVFAHSMIPRLGAAVGIGYLFLAAAPDLMRLIYHMGVGVLKPAAPWTYSVLAGLLVAGALGYISLHIWRRVKPPPRSWALLARAANVLALGVHYAVVGLALFGPLLFHPRFLALEVPATGEHAQPGAHQLLLCGAIALSLGVALQLVWEEKPLTEPL